MKIYYYTCLQLWIWGNKLCYISNQWHYSLFKTLRDRDYFRRRKCSRIAGDQRRAGKVRSLPCALDILNQQGLALLYNTNVFRKPLVSTKEIGVLCWQQRPGSSWILNLLAPSLWTSQSPEP